MSYCSTCLSSDRRLKSINDLNKVIPIAKLLKLNLNMDEVRICWECEARFSRIHSFRRQVFVAQKMFKIWYKTELKYTMESLSKLHVKEKECFDKVYLEISEDSQREGLEEHNFEEYIAEDWEGSVHSNENDGKPIYILDEFQDDVKDGSDTKPVFVEDLNKTSKQIDEETLGYKVVPNLKLTREEQNFIVGHMTYEEMYKSRDSDRDSTVYKRCPFKCSKCIIGYYSEVRYKRHLSEKHETELRGKKRNNKCTVCEIRFTRRDALQVHYDRHFRCYKCKLCSFKHHKLSVMLAHKSDKHSDGSLLYTCRVCKKAFNNLRTFRAHKDTHKDRPKCDICGVTASNKSNLKVHMLVHTSVRRVQCDECGRRVRPRSLASHRRTHAAARDDAAFCAECGVHFASAAHYRRHLATSQRHLPPAQRRFSCTQCDMRFTDKFTLSRHVAAKHLKIYPFKCNVCNKGFIRKDRVQKHILERHEGISLPKDKVCVYCDKGFKDKESLKRHIRIHTGERPYSCRHCTATFAQSSTRNTHMKAIHADIDAKEQSDNT